MGKMFSCVTIGRLVYINYGDLRARIRGLFILVYLNRKSQPNHLFPITCGSNVTGIPQDGGRTTHTKHQSIYRFKEWGFDDLLLTASILSLRKHHG